jgi:hypothetical protein
MMINRCSLQACKRISVKQFFCAVLVVFGELACWAEDPVDEAGSALGVVLLSLDDAEPLFSQARTKPPTRVGVFVSEVEAEGPAEKAGLKPGDVIHKLDGKATKSIEDFRGVERALEAGKPVKVEGYTSQTAPSGKAIWKRGSVAVTPLAADDVKFAKMVSTVDEITGEKHFRHVQGPQGFRDRGLCVWYVQQAGARPVLWISFQWADEFKWIFFKDMTVRCGAKTFTYGPLQANKDVKRDNGSWGIAEWYALPCGSKEKEIVAAILAADDVAVRFIGDAERDVTYGPELRKRVSDTIEAFKAAGGDWSTDIPQR